MAEPEDRSGETKPAAPADWREGMTSKELYDWEWTALPRWVKAVTFLVGCPAFIILVWSAFDPDAVSGRTQTICFCVFGAVCLLQIYSLNRIVRDAKRRKR